MNQRSNFTVAFVGALFFRVGGGRVLVHMLHTHTHKCAHLLPQVYFQKMFSLGLQRKRKNIHHCFFLNCSPPRKCKDVSTQWILETGLHCFVKQVRTRLLPITNYGHAHSLKHCSYGKHSKVTFPTATLNTTPSAYCTVKHFRIMHHLTTHVHFKDIILYIMCVWQEPPQ